MKKILILCHPQPYNTHWLLEWFIDIQQNFLDYDITEIQNAEYHTVDIEEGGTIKRDAFSDAFIKTYKKSYDIVFVPDCSGIWWTLQNQSNLEQKINSLTQLILKLSTMLTSNGWIFVSKIISKDVYSGIATELKKKGTVITDKVINFNINYIGFKPYDVQDYCDKINFNLINILLSSKKKPVFLYENIDIKKTAVGIYNQNEYCFAISILNVLYFTDIFRNIILSMDLKHTHLLQNIKQMIVTLINPPSSELIFNEKTNSVYISLSEIKTVCSIMNYGQQDAHEFLGLVLNELEFLSKLRLPQIILNQNTVCQLPDIYYKSQIFNLTLIKTLTCINAVKKEYYTKSKCITEQGLSLEIPKNDEQPTLKNSIYHYLKKKRFSSTENYTNNGLCTNDQYLESYESLAVLSFPEVLIFQLKIFNSLGNKITIFTEFPLEFNSMEYFKLKDCITTNCDRVDYPHYYLSAVVLHSGNLNKGHYIVRCKDSATNSWFTINDEHVFKNTPDEVLKSNNYKGSLGKGKNVFIPYLLFYNKK